MPPVDSTVIEKLRKILARADTSRGATEAEAQAAMAAAQRLAIQHNVDLASISIAESKPVKIETDKVSVETGTRTRRFHHRPIARLLQSCFDVHIIFCGTSRIVIIGEKTDAAIAQYCWSWLGEVFPRLYSQYLRSIGSRVGDSRWDTTIRRRSFYEGLEAGICANNCRERNEAKLSADGEKYALVLVKKGEVVKARVDAEFPSLKTMRNQAKETISSAFYKGHQEGSQIKLSGGLTTSNGGLLR